MLSLHYGNLKQYIMKIVALMIISCSFISCSANYRNVIIEGTVVDKNSNRALSSINVEIGFWVYDMSQAAWESKLVSKKVVTDKDGVFAVRISAAESFDVDISVSGYKNYKYSENLTRRYRHLEIQLNKW